MKDLTTYTIDNIHQLYEVSKQKDLLIWQPAARTWFVTTAKSVEENFEDKKISAVQVLEKGPYLMIQGFKH